MGKLIENIPKVFWVQNKPFLPDMRNSEQAKEFQKDCLENNFFGMGWKEEKFNKYANKSFDLEIADELRNLKRKGSFTQSQNLYGKMEPGDVVLTRLNDEYFAGKILFTPKFSERENLTWYSKVEKWLSLGKSTDLPHHLRGKLSSRKYQGTTALINGIAAYTVIELVGIDLDAKPIINENNFFEALGDEDLEDLVAHYMSLNNKNYVFLPSSCKKNTPGIEFVMYNPENGEQIACQTKVNRKIDVGYYLSEHSFEKYKILYLYSGAGYNDYESEDLKKVKIISNVDLYHAFKSNKFFTSIVENYFQID